MIHGLCIGFIEVFCSFNILVHLKAVRCWLVHADPCRAPLVISAWKQQLCRQMHPHRRAATCNISPFSLIHVYLAGLHRITARPGQTLSGGKWRYFDVRWCCFLYQLHLYVPGLIAPASFYSSHFSRLSSITMFPPIEASITFTNHYNYSTNCVISFHNRTKLRAYRLRLN